MSLHHQVAITTGLPVYTDLSAHTADHLAHLAAPLNSRPRKTLGWETPAERLAKLRAPAS
jgi:IS30 family transposase